MKKNLYIVNPTAGKGKGKKGIPLIKSFCKDNSCKIVETKYPLHATELVIENKQEYKNIIAVGGDGTVNEVISGIGAGAHNNLGVLPVGSGNDFFKNIDLGESLKDSLSIINSPDLQKQLLVDIGKISFTENGNKEQKTHLFVNNLGFGFDAYVGYINQNNKAFSGITSYLYAVIKALFNYKMINITMKFDDREISGSKLLVSIGNGISSGGGFFLTPEALINDGLLDLNIIEKVTRRRLLMALPMALANKIDKIPESNLNKAERIKINLEEPYFAHCDGEIISKELSTAEITLYKNALNVITSNR